MGKMVEQMMIRRMILTLMIKIKIMSNQSSVARMTVIRMINWKMKMRNMKESSRKMGKMV